MFARFGRIAHPSVPTMDALPRSLQAAGLDPEFALDDEHRFHMHLFHDAHRRCGSKQSGDSTQSIVRVSQSHTPTKMSKDFQFPRRPKCVTNRHITKTPTNINIRLHSQSRHRETDSPTPAGLSSYYRNSALQRLAFNHGVCQSCLDILGCRVLECCKLAQHD